MSEETSLVNLNKPVIGLVHLPPLPGTYLNSGSISLDSIIQTAIREAVSLARGKIDAMLICNENDKPYTKKAEPHIIAQMTKIIEQVVKEVNLPYGVDVQWDPFASLAIAKTTNASFIRGLISGTFCGDLGIYSIDPYEFSEYRQKIGAQDIQVFTNLMPEFSYSPDQRPITLKAQTAFNSSLIDVVCVSGVMAGKLEEMKTIRQIKDAVGTKPVFVNTGVNKANLKEILEIADGCFVASSVKTTREGWPEIDSHLVEELMSMKG